MKTDSSRRVRGARATLMASCLCPAIVFSPVALAQTGARASGTTVLAAQTASDEDQGSDLIVVARGQGTRDARLNNLQTVDAIGEKDIDSMPSQNISDVLKRLPGVQVTYDNGEAQQPNIRGVGFIQTTVDGRETVTAGARALQIGDVPGDVITGVEIFKTPSANMIEGGIGGLIAVKTKQPLSYGVPTASGQMSLSLDESRNKLVPQGSVAVGASWDTGIGRIGASLGVAHTSVLLRSDFSIAGYSKGTGTFDINGNGTLGDAADNAIFPNFALPIQINARHSRNSVVGNLQWAPSSELTLSASYFTARYLDQSQQYSLVASMPAANSLANAGKFTLFDKSPVNLPLVRNGTFANAAVTAQSLYVRPQREVTQQSGSAVWERDKWRVEAQGDFTQSHNNNDILIFAAAGTAPNLVYTGAVSPDRPSIATPGFDLTNPASFTGLRYTQIVPRADSAGNSQRLDVEFRPDGFVTALQVGYRRTYRRSTSNQTSVGAAVTGTLATIPGLSAPSPDGDFVVADPTQFIAGAAFRTRLGLPAQLPAPAPNNFFRLRERTDAFYARALYGFQIDSVEIDGDVGLRAVHIVNRGDAFAIAGTSVTPIQNKGSSTDWLPSATVRAKLTPKLTARLSGSRTVARPGFQSLSPGLTLNLTNQTAGSGNPDLNSFYAIGVDMGLDWLFAPSGYATVAVFRKTLKGLVQTAFTDETIGGVVYRVGRPVNGQDDSSFKGIEINLNKKFVELPGLLAGFGVDGNYTYLKSELTNVAGVKTRIPGLATHTLNSSVYYDKGPLLVRLGYTITSDFVNNPNFGGVPELGGEEIFGRQDVVDATVQYRISQNFRVTANVMNALQPAVGYYNGSKETPNNSYQTFRRFQAGLKFDF